MRSKHHFIFAKFRIAVWWTNLWTMRKRQVTPQSQLAQLPDGIKVIKQNTTRPLVMNSTSCPKCGNYVRTLAAFCPNCGFAFNRARATPKPTIKLQPDTTEPVSDKLPSILANGELDKDTSEIIHIDLMLKVKLYLLWDRAGR